MDVTLFRHRREKLERDVARLAESMSPPTDVSAQPETLIASVNTAMSKLSGALQELRTAEQEMKLREQALQQSQDECEQERQRYADLFNLCPDVYLVSDMQLVIREANHAAAECFGHSSEDLCGKSLLDLLGDDEREVVRQRVESLPRLKRIDNWALTLNEGSDHAMPVVITVELGRTSEDGGRELRWLFRDVTAERDAETNLRRMQERMSRSGQLSAIGTLAAGLGHDVKNLLFPMRCRLDSLGAQQLPQQATEDVQGIRHVLHYLQQLSENLQLLSETPDFSPMPAAVTQLAAWWDHVAPLMNTATPRDVHVEPRLDENLPPVRIAPHQLTQAVMNLVNNAGEVVPKRGKITVWAQQAKHGPFVKIGVTDDGPGMSHEVLRRALDPFYTTKPRERGLSTGLGLSLVRSIVKSVGGSVRIDSAPEQGTTVILRVPVATSCAADDDDQLNKLPHAAVTVRDDHLASTLCTLLNLSRLPTRRAEAHDPGECSLWIAEPQCISPDTARSYLQHQGGRLILFGEAQQDWQGVQAIWIEQNASIKSLRDALSEIAYDVLHEHS